MHTEDLQAFFSIVETGSLTGAAKALDLPKSTISRRLARLEDDLGTTLMMRTPRSAQVTELGELLYRQGAPALSHLDEVERMIADRAAQPSGPLRISAPPDLAATVLGPLCAKLVQSCPSIEVSVVATSAFTNLVTDGFDVALRVHVGQLESSSSLRTRKLARVDVRLYAAPSYLEGRGTPRNPKQLGDHARLGMEVFGRAWKLTNLRSGSEVEIAAPLNLVSNDHLLLRDAALDGAGIAALPSFLGDQAVARGDLVRVLGSWALRTGELSVVWLATHHLSPRIRAFVDEAAAFFSPPPWTQP